ncbi:MAG: BatA domain-containing protein, partial [Niveispirillum sp.]|nr:BatA domain-containing protein [Niveispirillum sp.]
MLNLGPIAFAAPWLLLGLVALPLLYWLLKVTPPNPRTISFPAIRLLADLVHREETPNRTPLWILILRMVLAALVILALSRPLLNPAATLPGGGPLLLVVDNGWAAARDWPARLAAMDNLIDQADRQGRTVTLLATAPSPHGDAPALAG